MKKLLICTAVILGMSQMANAVTDEKILEVMKEEKDTLPILCAHLELLPEADKKRLGKIAHGLVEEGNKVQEELEKLISDDLKLLGCINKINEKFTW